VQRSEWEGPSDLLLDDVKNLDRARKVGFRLIPDPQKGRSYGAGYYMATYLLMTPLASPILIFWLMTRRPW
jgi:hypothetical protein